MAICYVCGKYFDGNAAADSLGKFGFGTSMCPKCEAEEDVREEAKENAVKQDAYNFAKLYNDSPEKALSDLNLYMKREKIFKDASVFYDELNVLTPELSKIFASEFAKKVESTKDAYYISGLHATLIRELRKESTIIDQLLIEQELAWKQKQKEEEELLEIQKSLKTEKAIVITLIVIIELVILVKFLFTSYFVFSLIVMILIPIIFSIVKKNRYDDYI